MNRDDAIARFCDRLRQETAGDPSGPLVELAPGHAVLLAETAVAYAKSQEAATRGQVVCRAQGIVEGAAVMLGILQPWAAPLSVVPDPSTVPDPKPAA